MKADLNVSWMSNPQYLAQVGHFFGAYAVAFTTGVLTGPGWLFWTIGAGLGIAALKEFWFDIRYEKDSWKNSAMDYAFYALGAVTALGLFEVYSTVGHSSR